MFELLKDTPSRSEIPSTFGSNSSVAVKTDLLVRRAIHIANIIYIQKWMIDGRCDLHVHSNHSDGKLSPADIVRKAAAEGVRMIVITDHDTVSGIPEAKKEARNYPVQVLNGVELTTSHHGVDLHLLGYMFEESHSELLCALEYFHSQRAEHLASIIHSLNAQGVELCEHEVAPTLARRMVSTTNILYALVRKGYATDLNHGYWEYLSPGKAAYRPKPILPIETASYLIRQAGGLVVLAHPGLIKKMQHDPHILHNEDFKQSDHWGRAESIASSGLIDGIEVWHSYHTPQDIEKAQALCNQYGLLATGGSDFHQEPRHLGYKPIEVPSSPHSSV